MFIGGIYALIGIVGFILVVKLVNEYNDLCKICEEREEREEAEDERLRLQDERDEIGHDEKTNPLLRVLILAVEKDGMDVAEDARYTRELARRGRRGGPPAGSGTA